MKKERMQYVLERLLSSVGKVTSKTIRLSTNDEIAGSCWRGELELVYRALNGALESVRSKPGSWDLEFDGMAVELDEQLHFNRYRAITLKSEIYSCLPSFPLEAYRRYCSEYEEDCLRAGGYGGKWSNDSCVKQFGVAGSEGDLAR
jgi:hypothetical protein